MNEEQALKAIRNMLRLEDGAKGVVQQVTPSLRALYKKWIQKIKDLPPDAIARELAWKSLSNELLAEFQSLTGQFEAGLNTFLLSEAPEQTLWAASWIGSTATPAPAMAARAIQSAEVLGKTLDRVFGEDVVPKSMLRKVDRAVKTGFLNGDTNTKIAKALAQTYNGQKAQYTAMARTATMSMAQEAHNEFWDANDDVITGWVYDATFDYRVCMICAPSHGEVRKKRSELPEVPRHPNCRCAILPRTIVDDELEAEGDGADQGDRDVVQLYDKPPTPGPNLRVYKTPVYINGTKMYRAAKVLPVAQGKSLEMGDFLWRANERTRIEVLGVKREARFKKLIMGTPGSRAPLTPQEALLKVSR
jgi:SPP1 gp7 family putative phage head morphogenesis protein